MKKIFELAHSATFITSFFHLSLDWNNGDDDDDDEKHYKHITLSLIWSQLKVGCHSLLRQK